MATGLQQTVFDIYAETKFDCPAQWLAEAFSRACCQSWKYQFSVTPAYHGADLSAYFSINSSLPTDFTHAFQKIWGNFITNDTPVISVTDATYGKHNSTVPAAGNGMIDWPNFTPNRPWQMNLNVTGGTVIPVHVTPNLTFYERLGPGMVNDFRLANAYTWEGGRGSRCDFWLKVSPRVPQ
jgi:carboxylesterase type B